MMSRLTACIVAIATILSIGPGFAHEFKKGSITVEHPWSRATPGGAKVATGYLTIENAGSEPDRLVSATAEIAGHTGIHQMSMVDGVMKMRELTEGLPVPADVSVALEPNSYHVAGGALLGGLLSLLILVRDAPPGPAAETLRRFSKLATFCVIAIAGTACLPGLGSRRRRGWANWHRLWLVLFLKAALFVALLGLAAINRFRLTPALERQDAQKARWALLRT